MSVGLKPRFRVPAVTVTWLILADLCDLGFADDPEVKPGALPQVREAGRDHRAREIPWRGPGTAVYHLPLIHRRPGPSQSLTVTHTLFPHSLNNLPPSSSLRINYLP